MISSRAAFFSQCIDLLDETSMRKQDSHEFEQPETADSYPIPHVLHTE